MKVILVSLCLFIIGCSDRIEPTWYQQAFRQLSAQKQYCRIHETRMGFHLGRKSSKPFVPYCEDPIWAEEDFPMGGQPAEAVCGNPDYAWYWQCVACRERLQPMHGADNPLNAPWRGFEEFRCRLHGHPLSAVAGYRRDYRYSDPAIRKSRMHFPNAGSYGISELTSPVEGHSAWWLSSCPDCEIAFFEITRYWYGPYR